MKRLLAILFTLCVMSGNAAQVYFNLQNFTTLPVQNKTFRMVPVTTAVTSGGATAIGEPFTTNTGTGIFYISNVVANSYDCTVITPVRPTTFRILIPDTNDVVDSSSARVSGSAAVTGTYDTTASDARYLSSSGLTTATNNLIARKDGVGTNLTLYQSGGKGLSLAAGASMFITNGGLTIKSNSLLTIGDGTGTAQLRFQVGATASDYTGSEQWNFKTAQSGGSDSATVARLIDLTNAPNATQFKATTLANFSIADGAPLTNIIHTGTLTNNGPTGLGGPLIVNGGITNYYLSGGFFPIISDSNKKLASATAMQFAADGSGYAASNTVRWSYPGALSINSDFNVNDGQNSFLASGDANFRGGAVTVRSGPANTFGAIVLLGNGDAYFAGIVTNVGMVNTGTLTNGGAANFGAPLISWAATTNRGTLRNMGGVTNDATETTVGAAQFQSTENLTGTLNVGGNIAATNALQVQGAENVTGALGVGGVGTFTNTLTAKAASTTTVPFTIPGIANGTTNQLEIKDSAGNIIGFVSSNGVYRTTNDFFATLQTTDNTTNVIYSFIPINNSAVRVLVDIVGYNSTSSASYGKLATFKNVGGVVTQVSSTGSLGVVEDDTVFEALITLSGTTVQIKVAGNTGKTVNWTAVGKLIYSQ